MMNATRKNRFIENFLRSGALAAGSAGDVLMGLPIAAKDRKKHQACIKGLRAIEQQTRALRRRMETITRTVVRLSVDETRPPTGLMAEVWP
jgi:hypothetical protein